MTPETKAKIARVTAVMCYLGQIPLMGWLIPLSFNMGKDPAYQQAIEQANLTSTQQTAFNDTFNDTLAQERLKWGLIIGGVVAVTSIPSYCPYAKQKLDRGKSWAQHKISNGIQAIKHRVQRSNEDAADADLLGRRTPDHR